MTNEQLFMKRLYGPRTSYRLLTDVLINVRSIREAGIARRVRREFSERIMMAVTEMNGCCCSYFYSQVAHKAGMDKGEIFYSLKEAQVLIEMLCKHYNTLRPHSTLGYYPPIPVTIVFQPSQFQQVGHT